ncbi:bifunctional adenosylcobinamide kinase/adenosylcobinamide-phosphate guanylyltransferase [Shewanella colwelliana]|uniref:bifunctional adenosylcobinamide kinase/adenosylcobinamide-phosphate guanylyltransferase n=1 Tax=Shewanella colwelliana TaxID=23 RepID=UPI00048ED06D|nr:bifunctional adenosylcobinamide kinase/adenosylcobinamide-phosphate guanylyltransferase [Shewanella colwelliana]MCZ4339082.1 bifunctional adenosylcobinamide kinase/adenosylcobinamide-phosphate guanylyltransferase [Shewanella colwelliana]
MIYFVLGGARSGKSRHALALAAKRVALGDDCLFVATAEAFDEEMTSRIQRHQQERTEDDLPWRTLECPLNLSNCLTENARHNQVILVDCLTLWLTNQLLSKNSDWPQVRSEFLAALPQLPGTIILVSNEVGGGLVAADPLSRQFVDEAGWLHQAIANIADEVVLVTAGLPMTLKG